MDSRSEVVRPRRVSRIALVFLILGVLYGGLSAYGVYGAVGMLSDLKGSERKIEQLSTKPDVGELVSQDVLKGSHDVSEAARKYLQDALFLGIVGTVILVGLSWFWQWRHKRKSLGAQPQLWLTIVVNVGAALLFVGSNVLVGLRA